ncbi:hypothetical protein [Gloeobacter violaceus]|uniref:Gsl1872 protein n=1 Tax=Gloeobacter violaceus (strain ATCC 29082 / PCC 7421) TaxID=251221 RepID=Q7NJG0_GLOVI|nr:hypothetical protein [Gloeobacter violaceus]BAC89813.1 gsl1872 [Gloeobacter violaceus PCC 7421]
MKSTRTLFLLVLLAALGLTACANQPSVEEAQKPGLGNTPVPSGNAPAPSNTEAPEGVPTSTPVEGTSTP